MPKPADKNDFRNYLRKAEELLATAKYAVETSNEDAAVINSIHCAINAVDALAVFYTGKRHDGPTKEL